jgi:hypothetical protein
MQAPLKMFLTVLGASVAFFLALAVADTATAAGCGCSPPPCCAPPTPPTPPSTPCCQPPGHSVNIPGVSVFVGATVVVNANVSAEANAQANGSANGSGQSVVLVSGGGGGGGGGNYSPGASGMIQNLTVVGGGGLLKRESYEASRSITKKVVIEAVCIDDKDVPHPASQVTPDREIDDAYDNELYRCIAGTHMQATIAVYEGQVDFSHGQTLACAKGDALYHSPGGKVECRLQKPARDCNERSLLRRFGAGVKILTMITVEKYSSFREQQTESSTVVSGGAISLDGGVGGITY